MKKLSHNSAQGLSISNERLNEKLRQAELLTAGESDCYETDTRRKRGNKTKRTPQSEVRNLSAATRRWRRVRDLNPRYAKYVHMISSHAPSTTRTTLQRIKNAFRLYVHSACLLYRMFLGKSRGFQKKFKNLQKKGKFGSFQGITLARLSRML